MLPKFLKMLMSGCKQRSQCHRGRSRRAPSQPREPRAPSQPRMMIPHRQPHRRPRKKATRVRHRGGGLRLMRAGRRPSSTTEMPVTRPGMTTTRIRSKTTAGASRSPGTRPHLGMGKHGRLIGGGRRNLGMLLAPSHRNMIVAPGRGTHGRLKPSLMAPL